MKHASSFFCAMAMGLLALAGLHGAACAAEDDTIAPAASMNERVLRVPGDAERPAMLTVTVLSPDGPGPFPMVVMNHGAVAGETATAARYRYSFSAYYFLSRGYAVVLPMMRGYAGSEGGQHLNGCNQETVGIDNAKDIRAVMAFMSSRDYIDGDKVVVAGQSFGGWNTLALGTLHVPKVRGLINFAGGAQISNCRSIRGALAQAAGRYAALTSIPSIWFYGDNDGTFSADIWHGMFERYTQAGGQAELVAYGPFMADSHNLLGFPEGLAIWAPKVDAFLSKVGLPSQLIHPEYLPTPIPLPTRFADLDDIDAVPYLDEAGRRSYRKFLTQPLPRVFVVAPGLTAAFSGGFDPFGRALKACSKAGKACRAYAADNDVTWSRPTSAPAPSHFASAQDTDALPYVNEAGRRGYQKYLTMQLPKAFVIAPDGAWTASSSGPDPLAFAMNACAKGHVGCKPYAVDRDVVW